MIIAIFIFLLIPTLLQLIPQKILRQKRWKIDFVSTVISFVISIVWVILSFKDVSTTERVLYKWLELGSFRLDIGYMLDPITFMVVTLVALLSIFRSLSVQVQKMNREQRIVFSIIPLSCLVIAVANNMILMCGGWIFLSSLIYLANQDGDEGHQMINPLYVFNGLLDGGLVLGCLFLFREYGTINFVEIVARATGETNQSWNSGASIGISLMVIAALARVAIFPFNWMFAGKRRSSSTILLETGLYSALVGLYLLCRLGPVVQNLTSLMFILTTLIGLSLLTQSIMALVSRRTQDALVGLLTTQFSFVALAIVSGFYYIGFSYLFVVMIGASVLQATYTLCRVVSNESVNSQLDQAQTFIAGPLTLIFLLFVLLPLLPGLFSVPGETISLLSVSLDVRTGPLVFIAIIINVLAATRILIDLKNKAGDLSARQEYVWTRKLINTVSAVLLLIVVVATVRSLFLQEGSKNLLELMGYIHQSRVQTSVTRALVWPVFFVVAFMTFIGASLTYSLYGKRRDRLQSVRDRYRWIILPFEQRFWLESLVNRYLIEPAIRLSCFFTDKIELKTKAGFYAVGSTVLKNSGESLRALHTGNLQTYFLYFLIAMVTILFFVVRG